MMRCDLQLDESKRFYLLASDADPECGMNRLNPGCYLMRGDNDGLGVLLLCRYSFKDLEIREVLIGEAK